MRFLAICVKRSHLKWFNWFLTLYPAFLVDKKFKLSKTCIFAAFFSFLYHICIFSTCSLSRSWIKIICTGSKVALPLVLFFYIISYLYFFFYFFLKRVGLSISFSNFLWGRLHYVKLTLKFPKCFKTDCMFLSCLNGLKLKCHFKVLLWNSLVI